MNRRIFLTSSLVSAAALGRAAGQHRNHSLPKTDSHYRQVESYIEEVPVPEYQWAPESAYESFRDIKYGVRLHWGPYSIKGDPNESWPFLKMSFAERQRYQELYKTWNPRGFDAGEWMDLFAAGGMKMFAFTSKHHDGFSMFHTRTRVRQRTNWTAAGGPRIEPCDLSYSIAETPFRRDIVKELCDAARKRNIKIDLYFSHPDWYDADFRPYIYHPLQVPSSGILTRDFETAKRRLGDLMVTVPDPTPEEVDRMVARHRAQLTELLTRYGKIDMVCLDMWFGPKIWPRIRETVLHLRKLRPDVMLRARGIGNYGDYYTPEGFVPGRKGNTDTPWFVIYPLGSSFSYEPVSENYKGAAWIVRNLVDSVAKGGNFMVGIGPDGDGRFHSTAVSQLKEVGEWLKVNGGGIYSTRSREEGGWSEGEDVRFTRTKDKRATYAFCLKWPGEKLVLRTVRPVKDSVIQMLGTGEPLKWSSSGDGIEVQIPPGLQDEKRRPCRFAWGFRIQEQPGGGAQA
ncbi:MAG TPA: alpha-L-fucosidase [Bryobacteraceae bacterium]|nr:alpha-L-fucosidase [Bryobacteraceae bacterium]